MVLIDIRKVEDVLVQVLQLQLSFRSVQEDVFVQVLQLKLAPRSARTHGELVQGSFKFGKP